MHVPILGDKLYRSEGSKGLEVRGNQRQKLGSSTRRRSSGCWWGGRPESRGRSGGI